MGNKQARDLTPEERQILKKEKDKEKALAKLEKERIKREKKEEKQKRKKRKGGRSDATTVGDDASDAVSEAGSAWSERSVGSAPASWYHSASEPSSKRSSIYMHASAGPGYYQHDCWYAGYEDSSSEKSSKTPSRASSSVRDTSNLRAGSLERYPLGVPSAEAIEPMQRGSSLDFSSAAASKFLKERKEAALQRDDEALETAAVVASRYDEAIRASRDKLEKSGISKPAKGNIPLFARQASSEPVQATESPQPAVLIRGEKRKVPSDDQGSVRSSLYYSAEEGSIGGDSKRRSVESSSVGGGSIYYSADEGGSMGGSIYYSATSGSEVEERVKAMEDEDLAAGRL